jgi:hypothetical protein
MKRNSPDYNQDNPYSDDGEQSEYEENQLSEYASPREDDDDNAEFDSQYTFHNHGAMVKASQYEEEQHGMFDSDWITKQHAETSTSISASRLHNMFFGAPPEGSNRDTPYSSIPRSRWSMTDFQQRNCVYLTDLQNYQFKRELEWPVLEILSLRVVAPDTTVVMGSWDTPDTLLGRTPEETASVVVKSQYTSRETSLSRYGMGFQLRHGFMLYEAGRLSYKMFINSISKSLVATTNCMVLNGLMRTKVERLEHGPHAQRRWINNLTLGQFRVQMKESFNSWARIAMCSPQRCPAALPLMNMLFSSVLPRTYTSAPRGAIT